ncbi:MAG: hypothetical protein ACKOFX_00400, partial [Solirubrobacterales bacterium]
MTTRITAAHETDIPSLLSLNNRYAGSGLTLARTPDFAANHLGDSRVLRDATGGILGCVALAEYSPSVAELISLAVAAKSGVRASVSPDPAYRLLSESSDGMSVSCA